MKKFVLVILITIAFISCKSVESQQVTDSNLIVEANAARVVSTPIPQVLLKDLTKVEKQILNEKIPPKIREILDKADEINIYYDIDKETNGLRVLLFETVPNAGARVSNASLKKQFLDSFYYDASSKSSGNACFSPRHKITAKYKNKTVEIDICYQCKNFQGKSTEGTFAGGLADESKSSKIINEIIEKYGTDLQ